MRSDNQFHNFRRVVFLAGLVCFCSCEGDPFDSNSKQIAHGYRLKRIGDSSQFAFLAPYDTGGLIIDEVGWRKPFILAGLLDLNTGTELILIVPNTFRITDAERRSDSRYRSIPIESAAIAWSHLERRKRIW